MAETRKFSIHPAMIYNLIKAQAGTLGKAVLENIMNSVDARSSKVTITIDRDKITIVDDGHGFRSLAEIEECFDVFGFPHEEGARIYGQFGIGRAQLWSFSSAVWSTNTFKMDVNIKDRGLDYQLHDNQEQVNGLTIESRFYTPMSTQDILAFKQDLKELAMFAQIPVILNGEVINVDPSTLKWDFETAEAWIKLSDKPQLTVYHLGVLVRKYPAHQVGSGGLVVTRPGVKLALNMARNDILVAECKVWGRIKPFIQKKSDEKVRRKITKLSDAELTNRTSRFLSGEISFAEVADLKLISDITNRGHTIESFMTLVTRVNDTIVTVAEEGSILGDRAHVTKAAFVLHPSTLTRFGADNLADFHKALIEAMDRNQHQAGYWYGNFKGRATFESNLGKAVPSLREGYALVPEKEWTKKEKAALHALRGIEYRVRTRIQQVDTGCPRLAHRRLGLGLSETADAWTDAKSTIIFERETLKAADNGFGGFVGLVSTLTHEYLHDDSSTGTHMHDEHFYQRFHDAHDGSELGNLAFLAYRIYVSHLMRYGIKPSKRLLEALTSVEDFDAQVIEPESPIGTVLENKLAA